MVPVVFSLEDNQQEFITNFYFPNNAYRHQYIQKNNNNLLKNVEKNEPGVNT